MKIDKIKSKIKNRIPGPLRIERYYSVLIPVFEINNRTYILYEVRADHLSTQPGEISFPGGRVERGETFCQGAVRECSEELNIAEEKIDVMGEVDYLITPFNFIIYAFVAKIDIDNLDEIEVNKNEVKEIFKVPVDYLMTHKPEKYRAELESEMDKNFPYHLIPGGEDYNHRRSSYTIYFYRYEDRIIWGITAEISKNFIDILKNRV